MTIGRWQKQKEVEEKEPAIGRWQKERGIMPKSEPKSESKPLGSIVDIEYTGWKKLEEEGKMTPVMKKMRDAGFMPPTPAPEDREPVDERKMTEKVLDKMGEMWRELGKTDVPKTMTEGIERMQTQLSTTATITALQFNPKKLNSFIEQNPDRVIKAADEYEKWVGPFVRTVYPSRVPLAIAEKLVGRNLASTFDELSEKNPKETFVMGLAGELYNFMTLSKVAESLGIKSFTTSKLPSLDKLSSPFLRTYFPKAIEMASIWGTKGLIDEVSNQIESGEFNFSQLTEETGKNALFGTLLATPLSTPSTFWQIMGTGNVFAGTTAVQNLLEDGTLDTNDLFEIGTSQIFGMALGALGAKGRVSQIQQKKISDWQWHYMTRKFGEKNAMLMNQLNNASTLERMYPHKTTGEIMEMVRLLPKNSTAPIQNITPSYFVEQQIKSNMPRDFRLFTQLSPNQQSSILNNSIDKAVKKIGDNHGLLDAVFANIKEMIQNTKEVEVEGSSNIKITKEAETSLSKATNEQKKQAHTIARNIGLMTEEGEPDSVYRDTAVNITGKKSMTEMTEEEADLFVSKLKEIESGPPVKMTDDFVNSKFAELTNLKEVGAKESLRNVYEVFEKIGLTEDPMFDPDSMMIRELNARDEYLEFKENELEMRETVSHIKNSEQRIWRYVNNTLDEDIKLTSEEMKVANWAKNKLDDWADRLKIPQEKRRKHYITHILEEEIAQALKENKLIGVNTAAALDYSDVPKNIFNPYLQKRIGIKVGVKEDIWASIDAYVSKGIQVYHYQPLLEKLSMYQKTAPPNTAKYLKEFSKRLTHEPLQIDREIQQDLKEFAQQLKKIPGMENFASQLEQGNPAGTLAYSMTGLLYEMWLGLRPASAIKNLSQQSLIICESGIENYFNAKRIQYTKEGKDLLKNSVVLRSREEGFFLPGVDEGFIKNLHGKRRQVAMALFKRADKDNVGAAFLTGYIEATKLGLPHEWAVKRGDEVARKTQYVYTKMMAPQFNQSSVGRVLGVFTSWPRNWLELINKWIQGKPSKVYQNYVKDTGKSVGGYKPNGIRGEVEYKKNKSALWRYLALVLLAGTIQQRTRVKALYYTGWTSIKSLVDMATLNLPGLSIPKDILGIIAESSQGNIEGMKRHWRNISPDKQILIIKQLEETISGEKDWLNLFFYLDDTKDGKNSPGTWPGEATPLEFEIDEKDFEMESKELEIKLDW